MVSAKPVTRPLVKLDCEPCPGHGYAYVARNVGPFRVRFGPDPPHRESIVEVNHGWEEYGCVWDYPSYAATEGAVGALRGAGFRSEDISVLFPENPGNKDLAHSKSTKAPEGATAGGISGAVIGGTLGWLAGIGAIAIPGIGPLIAAGPIVAALAGVGAGGAVAGIAGALIGMDIPEYEAKRYEGRIRGGGILLSVHSDDSEWTKRAKEVLERTGAEDIASTSEASADFAKTDRPLPRSAVGGQD